MHTFSAWLPVLREFRGQKVKVSVSCLSVYGSVQAGDLANSGRDSIGLRRAVGALFCRD